MRSQLETRLFQAPDVLIRILILTLAWASLPGVALIAQAPDGGGTGTTSNGGLLGVPAKYALGDIAPQSRHARTFVITNRSSGPIRISRVVTSCKCTETTDLSGRVLRSGESVELTATLNAPATPGIKNAKVQVVFDVGNPLTFELEGDVAMAVRATPAFIGGPRGQEMVGNVLLESADGRPFRILAVCNQPPEFSGAVPDTTIPRSKHTLRWDLARIPDLGKRLWWVVFTDHPDCPVLPLRIRNAATGARADSARFERHWLQDESFVNGQVLTAGVPAEFSVVIKHYNPRARNAVQKPAWREVLAVSSSDPRMSFEYLDSTPVSDEEVRVRFRVTPSAVMRGPTETFFTVTTATGSGPFTLGAVVEAPGR
ncbi:MAG: hypothetical protein CMJ33_10495 [Phycisphaerae bacterium]|nr:hypothetical protein [Phycisphaerae bacterium]HAW96117.1 hypothetical protein [Phycisphaerales bacterium]